MSELNSSVFYTFCIIGSLYYLKYTNPIQYKNFQSIVNTSSVRYKYKLSLYKLILILNQVQLQNTLTIFNLPYFIEAIYKYKNELEEIKKLKNQVDILYKWSQLYKTNRT